MKYIDHVKKASRRTANHYLLSANFHTHLICALFIYLFNFAIIIHNAWQGHYNSITPITVGPLSIIKIQQKTEIKHDRNLEKSDINTTLKAKGHTPAKISRLPK